MEQIAQHDGRLSFDEALARARQGQAAAFAVTPVFGDNLDTETRAEGARVFVLLPDPGRHARDGLPGFLHRPRPAAPALI